MVYRIGLLGPYSSRNLGDTAIQSVVIDRLRAMRSDVQLVGICPDCQDTARTHGIDTFPLEPMRGRHIGARWTAMLRVLMFVGSLDALVISGGGQLDEFWGGPWGHPFWLWCWTWCARLRHVPVAVLGIGMDRLESRLSRYFVLRALRLARFRAFRDVQTFNRLRALGLTDASEICPDLAFDIDRDALPPAALPSAPYAVVSPISARTWTHALAPDDDAYFAAFAGASLWLMNRGLRVRFVCTQSAMDLAAVERVTSLIDARYSGRWEIRYIGTVDDYLQEARAARVVLMSRLHGAILALIAGTPIVTVAPLSKVTQLMLEMDLSRYCEELHTVSTARLVERLQRALREEAALRAHIRVTTAQWRTLLDATWERMTASIGLYANASTAQTRAAPQWEARDA